MRPSPCDRGVIVNAAGPWIDRVIRAVGLERDYIGGTKGSHLVVDNPALVAQLGGRMVYFGSSDGRICLVYPFYDRALIGSTDIAADDPDHVVCDDAEADYMIAMMAEVFPGLPVTREQIVYRYSGIRPLPAANVDDPGEISRDHSIQRDRLPGTGVPVLSLVGGKWTTFRAFAAGVTDEVLGVLGRSRIVDTKFLAIGGGRAYPANDAARDAWIARVADACGVERVRVAECFERYGTRAETLLAPAFAVTSGDEGLASLPDYGAREIRGVIATEDVVTLADIVLRRLPIAVAGRLTRAVAEEIATIAARALRWSDDERTRQLDDLITTARVRHGIELDAATPAVIAGAPARAV